MKIVAAIDIGTNSVLLTVVRCEDDGGLFPILEEAHITRLGEGLGLSDRFTDDAMERTMDILRVYARHCEELETDDLKVVGTAAFRKAKNAKGFVAGAKEKLGLKIEVITGKREAELSYLAASRDFGEDILVIDVGGGSTELVWKGKKKVESVSLHLGSVALHEKCCRSDPISDAEYDRIKGVILQTLVIGARSRLCERFIALAGTATTLAAMHKELRVYSHADVHGTELAATEIDAILERLKKAPLRERKKIPGLEPKRADVILEGAMIIREAMRFLGYDRVTISDRGLRWGLIYEML